MKSIIFLLIVSQAFSHPSETAVSESGRGVLDSILKGALQICFCRCGLPNREMRSLNDDKENTTATVEDVTPIVTPLTEAIKLNETIQSDINKENSTSEEQGKLIGGDVLATHSFPWLVLIMLKGDVVAGGAIISDRHIITAASPLSNAIPYDVKARISVHDQCAGDVTSSNVSVESIVFHPAYAPASRAHDIALLRLSNLLRFDQRLHPICLPSAGPTYREVATVVSWLSPEGDAEPASCEPKRVRQPILPEEDCSRAVTSPHLLTPDKSCVGVFGSKPVFCSGDVGAPLQVLTSNGRYELLGILPDINVCQDTTNATLFIRIFDHLNWIKEIIASDCICRFQF